MGEVVGWWAEGLLFENCNCQIVCPGHMSFRQSCTQERCMGHWAIRLDRAAYGGTRLDGLNVVILYDAPQQMFAGNWVEAIYVDERADADQREALDAILKGRAGGPWAVLARFVGTWLDTRYVPIELHDEGRRKSVRIEGLFDTTVEALRGRDPDREVLLENLFNQIHGSTHVLAKGTTRVEDRSFVLTTDGTHALYSSFSWKGP